MTVTCSAINSRATPAFHRPFPVTTCCRQHCDQPDRQRDIPHAAARVLPGHVHCAVTGGEPSLLFYSMLAAIVMELRRWLKQ
jgi:hypothetical protein